MILLFAILIVAAVLSTKVTSRFGMPVLVAFLGIRLVVGSDVLNLIYFDDAAHTRRIADILLVFIIFEGGFQTSRRALRAVAGPALTLATLGVAVTAGLLAILIHLVAGFDLWRSLMIASIISSTDAAAVLMATRSHRIRDRVATTLNVESAANDPMAILLTVAFVEVVAGKTGSAAHFALQLVWQLVEVSTRVPSMINQLGSASMMPRCPVSSLCAGRSNGGSPLPRGRLCPTGNQHPPAPLPRPLRQLRGTVRFALRQGVRHRPPPADRLGRLRLQVIGFKGVFT